MSTYTIAVIVGSLRAESINRKLAGAVVKLAPPDFSFIAVDIGALPLFNQDQEADPCEAVVRMKAGIAHAHGLLIVTPEYSRSLPGVLKNALDHGSRPYGKSVWAGKPAGIMGASFGPIGTAAAQQHLRSILGHLDVITMGQPEAFVQVKEGLFDADGGFSAESRPYYQKWMDRYVAWVKLHAATA
jgi:chromate reductase